MKRIVFLFALVMCFVVEVGAQNKEMFNQGWEFSKATDTVVSQQLFSKGATTEFSKVSLPHTAHIEPIEKVNQQWQGICFYRKFFSVPAANKGKHIALQFDAAMHEADVYLNGKHIFRHVGGYLPFYIDVSNNVRIGEENCVVVKLDNRDNPVIPPGKPIKDLDFNYYSGIYRNAWLITKEKLYITNAVAANATASGGILVHSEDVSNSAATLMVQAHVANDYNMAKDFTIRLSLADRAGKTVATATSKPNQIDATSSKAITQRLTVNHPTLWSVDHPYLYQLKVAIINNGKVVDEQIVRTGVRSIRFDATGFYLNNNKVNIRGTNRHQEYPYVGNALSDNAQYRDAYKIKLAGFNFVRTSHYPQATSFLDACDELGLLVMDAIPGWQFIGNEAFKQNSYQDIRDMIRRDRNHPSIILWEASLNESRMTKDYMQQSHNIVHNELPFKNIYSAGWVDEVYDVFLPARQHGKAPDYWKKYNRQKPLLIAEYGDWEYYAQNAGFNQTEFKDLKKEEKTSRQLRGFGEKRMLQQALNFQEAHNDNLNGPAVGDANWLMFDYKRGYAADIESSGIMDIVRLPKFAFYFYQSQVDPIAAKTVFNKPMLHIANYWDDVSDTTVKIFSNCDEVELILNGKTIARQKPDNDVYSNNLKHPPFTFHLPKYVPGTLTAVGFINKKQAATQTVKTPGKPAAINLQVDYSGKGLKAGQKDLVFVYATVTDANGTVVPTANNVINFNVKDNAEAIGLAQVAAEAGIATILLQAGSKSGTIKITANGTGLTSKTLNITSD